MISKKELHKRARALRQNMTDAEKALWQHLRNRQMKNSRFRRQMVIGSYIVDFCCPETRLIIEIDGGQHQENLEYDKNRTSWLESQGYTVLRFWNHEVLQHLNAVKEAIYTSIR
jgi:very-short-patch-repair endonuclease